MSNFAPFLADLLDGYLTEQQFHELAAYNGDSDLYGGPKHYTEDEQKWFAILQARWDEANRQYRIHRGYE